MPKQHHVFLEFVVFCLFFTPVSVSTLELQLIQECRPVLYEINRMNTIDNYYFSVEINANEKILSVTVTSKKEVFNYITNSVADYKVNS